VRQPKRLVRILERVCRLRGPESLTGAICCVQLLIVMVRMRTFRALSRQRGQRLFPVASRFSKIDAILRPPRSCQGRHYAAEIQFQGVRVSRLRRPQHAQEPLLPAIALDQLDVLLVAAAESQVCQCLGIDREEADRGAGFRRHIGDGGPVGYGQGVQAVAKELHELPDDTLLPQHLHNGENEVSSCYPLRQSARKLETNHLGDEHRNGLAQHRRFGLDTADSPADHTQGVDHGRMGVCPHQGIWIRQWSFSRFCQEDHRCEVFEIDLVHDSRIRRHHAKSVERRLAPLEELVALVVAFELQSDVLLERTPQTVGDP